MKNDVKRTGSSFWWRNLPTEPDQTNLLFDWAVDARLSFTSPFFSYTTGTGKYAVRVPLTYHMMESAIKEAARFFGLDPSI